MICEKKTIRKYGIRHCHGDRNICRYKLAPYDDAYLGKDPKLAKKTNRTLDKFTILEYCNR